MMSLTPKATRYAPSKQTDCRHVTDVGSLTTVPSRCVIMPGLPLPINREARPASGRIAPSVSVPGNSNYPSVLPLFHCVISRRQVSVLRLHLRPVLWLTVRHIWVLQEEEETRSVLTLRAKHPNRILPLKHHVHFRVRRTAAQRGEYMNGRLKI